jgi:hypothetical protein
LRECGGGRSQQYECRKCRSRETKSGSVRFHDVPGVDALKPDECPA